MAGFDRDLIYCSPLLPVASLDAELANRKSPLFQYRDPADSPEEAMIKARDYDRLHRWARDLPPDLSLVARGMLRGETQASIARSIGISEPAVVKRLARIGAAGKRQLRDLRASPLLT